MNDSWPLYCPALGSSFTAVSKCLLVLHGRNQQTAFWNARDCIWKKYRIQGLTCFHHVRKIESQKPKKLLYCKSRGVKPSAHCQLWCHHYAWNARGRWRTPLFCNKHITFLVLISIYQLYFHMLASYTKLINGFLLITRINSPILFRDSNQ